MKLRLLTLLVITFSLGAFAQTSPIDTLYQEKFDQPSGPDSVNVYHAKPLNTSDWNDTNFLSVSPNMSFHARTVAFDTLFFETDPFSTDGKSFVRLSFNHICKIAFIQQGFVSVSVDGGNNWQKLTGTQYRGTSPNFSTIGYFNELNYNAPSGTPYWGGTTTPASNITPTNSWWAKEDFDISDIAGIIQPNGDTGFVDVRVRFELAFSASLGTTVASGWYVDNLLVEGAPCELQAPQVKFSPIGKPSGARYQPSETVALSVIDKKTGDAGVDRVEINYSINNAAWIIDTMQAASGGTCLDSNYYTYTFNNLNVGDTIDWFIEAYDCACPNLSRNPLITNNPDYYSFWRDVAPPAICGPSTPNSFPNVETVTPLTPYLETFDALQYWTPGTGNGDVGTAHRGSFPTGNPSFGGLNWSIAPQASINGFGWSVRNSPTGTALTGPDVDHSPNGANFIYAEASQGSTNSTTEIVTPCIDLSALSCPGVEFYYHMYGAQTGYLRIDIDTGDATSSYVNKILRLDNQLNTSSSSPWNKAFISLKDYTGKIVKIRFLAIRGPGEKGDIAIDDVRVFETEQVNAEVLKYYTPQNGYCTYTSNDSVTVQVGYQGCQDITKIPMAFKVENIGTGTSTVTWDTISGNIQAGFNTNYKFNIGADLSAYGEYNIYVYCSVPGDTSLSNDSIGPFYVKHETPYNSFPYFCDFDSGNWAAGNNTNTNPGTYDTTLFKINPIPTSINMSWLVGTDLTPTSTTGPRRDRSGNGNYIYTESSLGTNPNALMYTNCVDLSSLTNPVLSFWYHMAGAATSGVLIQIIEDGKNTWTTIPNSPVYAPQQANEMDPWRYKFIDLSAYAGTVVKLRIIGARLNAGTTSDIALDDLYIYDQPNTDVGIVRISPPTNKVDLANPVAPKFYIRNFGKTSVSNIPISYSITPTCGPNAGVAVNYTETYTGTIAAGAEFAFTAANMPNYPEGTFEICATTTLTGDNLTINNDVCAKSVGWPSKAIQNGFFEDFDDCTGGSEIGFFSEGGLEIWEIGAPNNGNISSAASAPNVLMTGLTYNYFSGKEELLYLPKFSGFDTIAGPEIRFKHRFNLGTGDGLNVEYKAKTGNGWNLLGYNGSTFCPTWYNAGNISTLGNGPGWESPGPTTWQSTCWPLSPFNQSPDVFSARFRLKSAVGSNNGWAIDDLEIYIPPQNSAHPININTEEYIIIPFQDNHIYTILENTGAKKLTECKVQYSIDGGPFTNPELVTFSPSLFSGQTMKYTFNTIWANPTPGPHTVCVVTSRPNNKQDNLPTDDTLCLVLNVLDLVDLVSDTSYCNDFEDPNKVEWVSLNTFYNYQGLTDWQKGTPNQAPIVNANSGSNAWMTGLNSNYKLRDSSALITPVFEIDSGVTYELNFMHNFLTERYHDGGCVEVTIDGINWYNVGDAVVNAQWHNTEHVTALDLLKSGWTGETPNNNWIESKLKISFEKSGRAVFRFRFGSDYSFNYNGWAIDDFCIKKSSGASWFIGKEELELQNVGIGNIIPNPSSGETYIPFVISTNGYVKVTAYNMLGQQMMNSEQEFNSGENRIDFNVSTWEPGVYMIHFELQGTQYTRKMIVQ